jgi:hypothetical protein
MAQIIRNANYGPKIVTDGLVAYYDAVNPRSFASGSSVVYNLLNSADSGSLTGSVAYSSDKLGAVQFRQSAGQDGITINTPVSSSFATYEVWMRGTRNGDYGFIMFNGSTGFITQTYMAMMVDNSTVPRISAFINAGTRTTMVTDITASINSTYHICLVVSGTQQANYVNGILQKTGSIGTPVNYDTITYFGDTPTNNSRGFSGSLYSARFYNKALTSQEVLQNFNAARGRFGV